MDYGYPQFWTWLWAPWTLLGLAALLAGLQWRAQARAAQASLARRFGPYFSGPRAFLKLAVLALATWFLWKALACPLGPVVREGDTSITGSDLVAAVDVSLSMNATDVQPSRLGLVKHDLDQVIQGLDGDRVGLVAFAGSAVVACPLTADYDTAGLFLDKLDNDSVPLGGTGLGLALATCLDKFQADPKRGRAILLATDGEDTLQNDRNAVKQARRAAAMGVPVITLGAGTARGAYIPTGQDFFGRTMVKMYHGEPVVVHLDADNLRRIAKAGGGEYINASDPAAAEKIMAVLKGLRQGEGKQPAQFRRALLYQGPLFTALLLLLAEALLSVKSGGVPRFLRRLWAALAGAVAWVRRRRRAIRAASLGALAALALAPACLKADFSLDPGRDSFNRGNAEYNQGQYQQAVRDYQEAGQKRPHSDWPEYNAGNAFFQSGDFDSAIQSYKRALEIDPHDADAAYNLKLAEERERQQKSSPKQDRDQKRNQNQNQNQSKDGQGGKQKQQAPGAGGQKGGRGQEKAGKGQQAKDGQGKGGRQQAGQAGSQLSNDQIQAMMNMLNEDQKSYEGAFHPLKERQQQQQDPFDQMIQQMTGMRMPQQPQPGQGPNTKDW